ncbi:MAG: DinB family protein [Opitutales bacterium]|jgi:uncharacterized damage-inducible protein DinB
MNEIFVTDARAGLEQGIALLRRLSPAQYVARSPACFNSSIGGHIRHNHDHFACFFDGLPRSEVDYDARTRDPRIETDPVHAALRLADAVHALTGLDGSALSRDLYVKMDSGSDARAWTCSTAARELQFLISHTIHHYAMIAVICHGLCVTLDPAFGVAPSTLRRAQPMAPCAR